MFIYLWLYWVLAAAGALSLVWVLGLLIASLLVARRLRCWLPGARAKAQQLGHPGTAAPWHMRLSQIGIKPVS